MSIVIGMVLMSLGCYGIASSYFWYIKLNRSWFLYSTPDTVPLVFLFLSIIVFLVGIALVAYDIIKKRKKDKKDSVTRIKGADSTGRVLLKNKCPVCNLNVSDGCKVCPQCGNVLIKEN